MWSKNIGIAVKQLNWPKKNNLLLCLWKIQAAIINLSFTFG